MGRTAGSGARVDQSFTVAALTGEIAKLFPPQLAEPWDNVGLLVGDPGARVRRVMTCLEVTAPTLSEARRRRADVMLAHHPLIFKPFKTLLEGDPAQSLARELTRSGISLIAAHTNLDAAPWGTNQVLAEACGLTPSSPLVPQVIDPADSEFKFVVFVPKGHERAIIEAIHAGGGGRIGCYTHCTFRTEGTGTFRGGEESNPFIGRPGRFEEAHEFRLEAVVRRETREAVLAAVLKAHPYEEPACEFYPLAGAERRAGLGCVCDVTPAMNFDTLIARIKKGVGIGRVRVSGPLRRRVRRVAVCTGSGGGFIARAASIGADVYLTGEISYHHGIEAHQRALAVVEVGHFESEVLIAKSLAERLRVMPWVKAAGVEVMAAKADVQPFVML